ncbi:spore coat protein [Paenibacillus larvae]|uniref:Spore coat protein n=3 Tax=Paenibacillus larvae TaxID=1464 RepID=V9W5I1_9BACL|nr:spore coat protein [Paenibacillus larvae]AHD04920.1 hypothetical protein ERIC2_c10880 [Paenibacillus larvae subsp. larvae DSM 25430]AQT85907.1 spore coat protein [Paenibacillus larvae subsp. pulvifaciens]AQZ45856.1 spore coat protein [Paenibacillus larvae subsp. pulvifaciens]ARF69226.1 spore coat protein [Paenibacillus larvae subsp. pulvifaciens]AVF25346.1 Spore coat protein F precursor [Paenibacillus larvae subsp. larvae]
MSTTVENLTGMNVITEQVIASDFLIASKSGVKDLATALTEATTPEVRSVLKNHLDTAITMHQKITDYMLNKGMYHPFNVNEQIQMDIQNAQKTLNLMNRS